MLIFNGTTIKINISNLISIIKFLFIFQLLILKDLFYICNNSTLNFLAHISGFRVSTMRYKYVHFPYLLITLIFLPTFIILYLLRTEKKNRNQKTTCSYLSQTNCCGLCGIIL